MTVDHLSGEQTRAFTEICETVLSTLTDPHGPAAAGPPWRRRSDPPPDRAPWGTDQRQRPALLWCRP
ncbi:hypothetical protein ACWCY6_20740 [Streptomyces sp. 900105755]